MPTSTPVSEPVLPTTIRPTATFVPLITPSPTPYILRLGVDEAKAKVDAGQAVLIDVRSITAFDQSHIAGAISVPENEVAERYAELPADRLIILYCD